MLRTLLCLLLLLVPALAQDDSDATWSARFAVVPLGSGSVGNRPPDVPADPNPQALPAAGGGVFKDPQLYVRFVVGPTGIDWSRTSTRWYFLPNGRTYVKMCDPNGNVSEFWGKYSIDGQGNVSVTTDAGEAVQMVFQHGRRALVWGDSQYTNIVWENEALQQMNNQ